MSLHSCTRTNASTILSAGGDSNSHSRSRRIESGSRLLRWPIDAPLFAIPVEQDVDARLGAELDRVALQAGRLLFPCAILRILLRDHFHGRLAFNPDDPDRLTEKIGIVKQVSL